MVNILDSSNVLFNTTSQYLKYIRFVNEFHPYILCGTLEKLNFSMSVSQSLFQYRSILELFVQLKEEVLCNCIPVLYAKFNLILTDLSKWDILILMLQIKLSGQKIIEVCKIQHSCQYFFITMLLTTTSLNTTFQLYYRSLSLTILPPIHCFLRQSWSHCRMHVGVTTGDHKRKHCRLQVLLYTPPTSERNWSQILQTPLGTYGSL